MIHAARGIARLIWLVVFTAWLPHAAFAATGEERRIALVIGISAYQNAPALANPVNDARAIGEALRRLKFDVTEIYDANFGALANGIREFGIRAAGADVALVYYAGHGVQVDRENYLLPSDAKLERERDLLYEAMPLERLLGEVSQASKIGMVLLDSCRSNPFIDRVSRSMSVAGRAVSTLAGLARVDNVPRNTMVVMAAKADQVAEDGGQHSPFAGALLAHFQIPGLELSLFFRSVRDTVLRATNNRQEPFVFSSLGAEPFYFFPRPPNRSPVLGEIKPLQVTDAAGPTALGIAQPADPDQDPLTVRFIGLPSSGEVRIDGRVIALNAIVSADKFMTATYKPTGQTLGAVGTVDVLVEDGRGGSVTGSLPVTVVSSHHPPVVEASRTLRLRSVALGIKPPTSPDGDPLTITVKTLPRGQVYSGTTALRTGDRLKPQELADLIFVPDAGVSGPAGAFRYTVDNGHGGVVEAGVDFELAPAGTGPDAGSQHVASAPAEAPKPAIAAASPPSPPPQVRPVPERPVAAPPPPDRQPPPVIAMADPLVPLTGAPSNSRVMTATAVPMVPRFEGGQAGQPARFQDCPNCPWMVRVPAGSLMMGQGSRDAEAMPAHRVELRSFALGQAPVTVAEWKACMAAGGCSFLPRMRVATDRTPVHNLSWEDTVQYTGWLSRTTGHAYRLPSEAEWEYAARAGTTTRYWWGDGVGVALANCADCGGTQDAHGPLPADAMRPNPFGLLDMLGGVAQWTSDCWVPNYAGAPNDGSPREAKNCEKRVLRGGGFREGQNQITVVARGNYDASVRYPVNGLRVARDPE
jgi:formylglycine-generating enzyme required for sulfatase activity